MVVPSKSESVPRGKLWDSRNSLCPRTNIRAYFRPKWRLLCLLSFKSFSQCAQFWIGDWYSRIFPSFSWGIFGDVKCLDHVCERKYLIDHNGGYWRALNVFVYPQANTDLLMCVRGESENGHYYAEGRFRPTKTTPVSIFVRSSYPWKKN